MITPDEPRLLDLLVLHEGLRTEPYRCPAGRWTWGVGHNLEARPFTLEERLHLLRHGPTEATARWLLVRDLEEVVAALDAAARERGSPLAGWHELDDVRQAVLVDMAFNLGASALLRFVKLLSAVARCKWADAGWEMENSEWWYQVGARARRLRAMLETGEWPEELALAST